VGRSRQEDVIAAYWRLAVATAKYHVAHQRAQPRPGEFQRSLAPGTEAEAELHHAKLQAVRAQHRLAQVLGWEPGRLPLAENLPHAGSYKTRYDEVFVGRQSSRAWELHQTLPVLYDLVKARATALAAAEADPALYARAANAFLDSIAEYNLAIAEYAVLAAGETLSGRELIPLLIRLENGKDDEQVARSRAARDRTSSRGNAPFPARGRTVVDPHVARTGLEQPRRLAPDRSALPRGAESSPPRGRVAQSPRADAPKRSGTPRTDEWRERDSSRR
jgi:hypothetical protein